MKKIFKDKISLTLLIINIISLALSISYFSYSLILLKKIETLLRFLIIIFFIILSILFIILTIRYIFKRKKIKLIIVVIITLIFSVAISYVAYNINKIYSAISNITTKTQTYSSSIVTRSNNDISTINDIKGIKIGIISDKESVDGYQIPQEIIKEQKLENEIVEYNNYIDLINALLDEKIDLVFLPTNYSILFSSFQGFDKLKEQTKIIYTKDKNIKTEKTLNTKNLDEPFTILLMGVDSANEEIKESSFNGDSLILITFNPKTLNATMLSIPRDTYTSITCFAGQKKNKITHAAWYGETCMMSTIEKMLDVNIDYYIKINFRGVVNIVDALGGVDVDVPYSMCEQNSLRQFDENMIYLKKGPQTLNGEQALALSRNRHTHSECGPEYTEFEGNDFIRGQNQQLVLQGMINKIKDIKSIDTLNDMLDSISQSMETNMSTENILSFYNIAKDLLLKNKNTTNLSEIIKIQRMYLSGYDQTIVDYDGINDTGSGLALYNFVPYQGSIKDISDAMKVNLGLKEKIIEKSFDFDINNEYEQKVIGKGYYEDYSVSLLPSFVGKDISQVQNYCSNRGITLTINKVTTNSKSLDGEVMTQSLPSGMDAQYAGSMTVTVASYNSTNEEPTNNEEQNNNETNNTQNTNDNTTDDNTNNEVIDDNIEDLLSSVDTETDKKIN